MLSTALIVAGRGRHRAAGVARHACSCSAGIVLGAWIDDFTRVGWGVVSVVTVLAVLAWVLDYVAGLLGARKAGASRQAIIGAALGTVAGIFMGLVGRALHAAGRRGRRRIPGAQEGRQRAVKVGVATWLGIMAGLVAKVVIAFIMIGLFVAALIF